MPTGYTAEVRDGKITSFREFALQCARGLGVCVTMRDDPLSPDIPEFTVGDYYTNTVAKESRRLADLLSMSPEQVAAAYEEYYEHDCKWRKEANAKNLQGKRNYEAMLCHAKQFVAPTKEHEGHRKFMIDQLEDSIRFDCSGDLYEMLPRIDPAEWHKSEVASAKASLKRANKRLQEETERVKRRNDWIKALRDAIDDYESQSREILEENK